MIVSTLQLQHMRGSRSRGRGGPSRGSRGPRWLREWWDAETQDDEEAGQHEHEEDAADKEAGQESAAAERPEKSTAHTSTPEADKSEGKQMEHVSIYDL